MGNVLKRELAQNYVMLVFVESISPLDFEAKVAVMKELMFYLKPFLSARILSIPPDKFAENYHFFINQYVSSLDNFKNYMAGF